MNGKEMLQKYHDDYREYCISGDNWSQLTAAEKGTFVIDVTNSDIRFIEGSKLGRFSVDGKLNVAVENNGCIGMMTSINTKKLYGRSRIVKEYLEKVLYDNDAAAIMFAAIQ